MAGLDKRVGSYQEALAGLTDNMTVLAGGFGLCGIPENLIEEIRRRGVRGLTVVSNNCGVDGPRAAAGNPSDPQGGGILRRRKRAVRAAGAQRRTGGGSTPQGHAGGEDPRRRRRYPGVLHRHRLRHADRRRQRGARVQRPPYIMETAITGDFAIVKGWKADHFGNVIYRHTAQNFNPLMATAGRITVVEVEEIVAPGELDPAARLRHLCRRARAKRENRTRGHKENSHA